MTMRMEERVQRGHYFAIVDEVDNVLIDEARTPLIISGPASDDTSWYARMAQVVRQLRPEDYEVSERDRNVTLTEIGELHVEEVLDMPLRDPDRPEDVTPEQARLLGYLEQALRAQFLFKRNKDYLVQAGKVIIIDEFTGRLMPGRRWSDGLHQAVEAKEGAKVQAENVTYATITIQNYFRMYDKLSGMTGTAVTEAEEFDKIYKREVLALPTNLEYVASRSSTALQLLEDRDEQGYKYRYYANQDDPLKAPVYWQRKDYPDVIYRSEEAKFRALMLEIIRYHAQGRPILLGTTSVELSERISARLRAEPIRRLAQVTLLRHAWLEQNKRVEDGRQIPELEHLNQPLDQLQIADLRKMARDLNISFNPEDDNNLARLLDLFGLTQNERERLQGIFQGGIQHQVLNARKHTEESQIIEGAGAFGAVTIATNMAGRGVDIKLGGELPEDAINIVNRVLSKAGHENPYEMRMEDRYQALLKLEPEQYSIYEADLKHFLQAMQDMQRVKELGGLHVIGSERHEARRIDNQLRGRSARQGDPGSSRFYLSLEDDLMRRFGGQQADTMMQRLHIDDAVPLEVGLVGRIVEQAQTRVEGANFDVRKHLLEYDDVLNSQRTKIYDQRDRIFTKDDLSEDVTEMLRTEVTKRVPESLQDKEGPWRLIAWMEQIQPPLNLNGAIFPSYSLWLLLKEVADRGTKFKNLHDVQDTLLEIAANAIGAEEDHLLHTVETLLDGTLQHMQSQIDERLEMVDTFFEGLGLTEEGEGESPAPRALLDELSALVRVPIRLSSEEQRSLRDDPQEVIDEVRAQVEAALIAQSTTRVVGAIERRLDESLELTSTQLAEGDWKSLEDQVFKAVERVLASRRERLLGADGQSGQIGKDLENALEKATWPLNSNQLLALLLMMPQGTRATFDKKTHRRVVMRTTRLAYTYYATRLTEKRDPEEIADEVLKHLEAAQAAIRKSWGLSEFMRVSDSRLGNLDEGVQAGLCRVLGEERCQQIQDLPLKSLDKEEITGIVDELGRQALTGVYRQLVLSVITELWVEYLTQMEALRVSIGLEAYAQRDPLVQYKSRASELFQTLLSNMRMGVITRMFTYRPRDLSRVQAELKEEPAAQVEAPSAEEMAEEEPVPAQQAEVVRTESDESNVGGAEKLSKSQKRRRLRR
jgi:preprotein translocase subunit SecA